MHLVLFLFFSQPLLFMCVQNNFFVQQVLSSEDFAPIAAGQNEVFYSKGSIFKEVRLPKDPEEQNLKEQEFLTEYESLSLFSNLFYVSGLSNQPNVCTFSYVQTDVVRLEEQLEDFQPFSGQMQQDFYCYQDRLIRHNFLSLDNNLQFDNEQLAHHQANNESFYKTYLLRMEKADGDLFDALLKEETQNWSWRLDMCYQIISRLNQKTKKVEYWHHLDIKPENILMQDFYTPLIGDLGNAKKGSILYDGQLKGTTAFLDPALITLKYFTDPQTQQEYDQIQSQIQVRYNMADEYALGATLLKILMPHTNLDYDQMTGYSNIMDIVDQATQLEEQEIMKFMKLLMTNDLTNRIRIEQAEYYFLQFMIKMKIILKDQIHLGQYLQEQFQFYVEKNYIKNKPQFWEHYVKKINTYYDLLKKNKIVSLEFNSFYSSFDKFIKEELKKKNEKNNLQIPKRIVRPQSTSKIIEQFFPLRLMLPRLERFYNSNKDKPKAIAQNKKEFKKNGLIRQFKIIGNRVKLSQSRLRLQKRINISKSRRKSKQIQSRSQRKNQQHQRAKIQQDDRQSKGNLQILNVKKENERQSKGNLQILNVKKQNERQSKENLNRQSKQQIAIQGAKKANNQAIQQTPQERKQSKQNLRIQKVIQQKPKSALVQSMSPFKMI